jgi:hypothetical protein
MPVSFLRRLMLLNLKIRNLEDTIIDAINASDLPIEVKRLIVSDVLNLILRQADKEVINEVSQNAEST